MGKQHILDEIHRTAKANGGAPLGVQRFRTETGIRESDWRGKYWARWGDALIEAGYTTNRKNEAYPREFLLSKLIHLARELGHFPVSAEMGMKARQDPTFPHHQTFARLGAKADQMRAVTEYCQTHEGFQDVLVFFSPPPGNPEEVSDEPGKAGEIGLVYLLKSGRSYNIGRSNSVGRGEYELAIQLPEEPPRSTRFAPAIRWALRSTGTSASHRNARMANGSNSTPKKSRHSAAGRRKFM